MAIAGKPTKGRAKIGNKPDDKSKAPPPPAPPPDDDNYEDGDIATPKADRYGDDDEPL
jgi:hypothetical protein